MKLLVVVDTLNKAHGLIHRENFDRTRTDTQQSREHACDVPQAKTGGDAAHVVAPFTSRRRIG